MGTGRRKNAAKNVLSWVGDKRVQRVHVHRQPVGHHRGGGLGFGEAAGGGGLGLRRPRAVHGAPVKGSVTLRVPLAAKARSHWTPLAAD